MNDEPSKVLRGMSVSDEKGSKTNRLKLQIEMSRKLSIDDIGGDCATPQAPIIDTLYVLTIYFK